MPRVVCPSCGTPDRLPDTAVGREVECRRCRTAFVAEPAPDAAPGDRRPRPNDGSGAAVGSLVLGVTSVCTAPFCGAGAVFGLGGLVTGFGGLRSRRRGASVAGLVFSLTGLILSVGVVVFFAAAMSAINRPIPARPDGTQPPFARNN